ncbi:MAG: extradiol ring-cleavage dioxygenase [Betaproteobacteria bacterium]|nr:extradiol ring-cleavage dioxygenase [Betaproteobacteria bacterium]
MSQILGLGVTHYPGLLVPPENWPRMLKRNVEIGRVKPELYADRGKWPSEMLAEWGTDEGVAAARAHEQRLIEGFNVMRRELDAFAPDLVLIWGDDQYENFRRDCIPAFCVYVFDELECHPYGGGRRPFQTTESAWGLAADTPVRVRGHREAANGLCRHLLGEGFDIAYASETRSEAGLAHSFNNTLVYLDRERRGFDYPVLPFHVNCYGNQIMRAANPDAGGAKAAQEISPPSPSPKRCFDIGRATGRFLRNSPWKVALIASSSWSHATLTAKHGRLYPDVPADRALHADLLDGGFARWGELPLEKIEDAGQHEVLNWICLAGAMTELGQESKVVDYVESWMFNSSKCFALFPPV